MLKMSLRSTLTNRVQSRTSIDGSIWIYHLGLGLLGFLLSRAVIMAELYPFGLAFMASITMFNRGFGITVFLSTIAGMLMVHEGLQLIAYLACCTIIFIILIRQHNKSGHWALVPGLVLAVDLLIRGFMTYLTGNEVYLWVGVIFESFFTAILTIVSSISLKAGIKVLKKQTLTADEKTSLGIVMLGFLIGINGAGFFGVGLQSILSRLLILWGALLGGPGGGAAVGVAVGLIPSIQGLLTTGPIAFYALSGLLGGIFHNFNKIGVAIGFCLGNLLMTLFFSEQLVIVQSLWESGIAVGFFLVIKNYFAYEPGASQASVRNTFHDDREHLTQRVLKISQVFSEMEKVFQSRERKNEQADVNDIFNKVASKVCEGCSIRKVCWEQEFYKTYRALIEACSTLEGQGVITEKDFGSSIKRRCVRLRELSTVLNSELEMHQVINDYQRRIEECSALLNVQFIGISRLLEDFAHELKRESLHNAEMDRFLMDKLKAKGISVNNIHVLEHPDRLHEIIISQSACKDKSWCRSMIAPNISEALGNTYAVVNQECNNNNQNGFCSCILSPSRAYKIETGKAQCPKEGYDICGDACTVLDLPDHRTILIMSDGMGAGSEAREESDTAISLLEKLLALGFTTETAVKTVNTTLFIRSGRENFATLDVVIFNTVNGVADFVKIGGAPSLICSNKGIHVIKAAAPPVGILDSIELRTERHVLAPGDMIIMMSDGVWEAIYESGGSGGWLDDILKQIQSNNPQKVAGYLLYLAKKSNGNKARDDMCIQIAVIEEEHI